MGITGLHFKNNGEALLWPFRQRKTVTRFIWLS